METGRESYRKIKVFSPPGERRGESYLFQKYIMMGKRDMMAPWKMLRSRWPSEMAARMESFWASEMFTYPWSGSLSLAEAPGKAPTTFQTTPSPDRRSLWWGFREGHSADPGLRRYLTISFWGSCGENGPWYNTREEWKCPSPSALEGPPTAGRGLR